MNPAGGNAPINPFGGQQVPMNQPGGQAMINGGFAQHPVNLAGGQVPANQLGGQLPMNGGFLQLSSELIVQMGIVMAGVAGTELHGPFWKILGTSYDRITCKVSSGLSFPLSYMY